MTRILISHVAEHAGEEVKIRGWLYNKRSSGKKLHFLIIRDGTGFIQCVASKSNLSEKAFEACNNITQESSIEVTGLINRESRAPSGYEIDLTDVSIISLAQPYPITHKEHGVDFLLAHRHLWLRTPRQHAIMGIRAEVIKAIRDYLDSHDFILIDAPILTPSACEGSTTLFETGYFDSKAYLSQSGQLYNEAAAMAFGRVYCFGPSFRAEKSKTRRHLMEFWMVEPEMAFCDFEENLAVQEELVSFIVERVLAKRRRELSILERDITKLEQVVPPFERITYDEAIEFLKSSGKEVKWGEDFGSPEETEIANRYSKPVFLTHFPAEIKAFYMKPDPSRPEVVLGADLLAPEGYGEIIGGGQRIDDLGLLEERLAQHKLDPEAYGWYVDLRRFGSAPHSGFGLGVERTLSWICGLEHVRETIPFPRMLYRLYP